MFLTLKSPRENRDLERFFIKNRVVFSGSREVFLGGCMNCKSFTVNNLIKEKRLTFQPGVKFLVVLSTIKRN